LDTLADARFYALSLSVHVSARQSWQEALEQMMISAESGNPADIETATQQLTLALLQEGGLRLE